MAGPGSQRNKPHKPGRRAGPSAREKHRSKKDASSHRASIKATHAPQGRADRLNATKQIRERKRAEVLEARRAVGPPRVIALLPLSDEVDVQAVWNGLLQACLQEEGGKERALAAGGQTLMPHQQNRGGTDDDNAMDGVEHQALVQSSPLGATLPLAPITVRMPDRKKVQFTFLPPPLDRSDPLMVVEIGRAAESVLFLLPGDMDSEHAVDEHGSSALGVLRALGMPTPAGLVQLSVSRNAAAAAAGLKERSAAKKRATEAFTKHIPGDYRMMHADTPTDFKQVLRHLADAPVAAPHWRRERPQLVVHDAHFESFGDDDDAAATAVHGRLYLTGYVRGQALSAARLVHVPGAGDFQMDRIEGPPNPPASNEDRSTAKMRRRDDGKTGDSALMEIESDVVDGGGDGGGVGNGGFPVLARVEAAQRESLQRENEINPLDAEQTWPTEEELAAAEAKARLHGKRRLLPRGTSEYQAAWILDDVDDEHYESDGDAAHDQGVALDPSATKAVDENRAFRDGDAAEMAEKIDEEEDSLPDLEFLGDGGATEADGMEYIAAAEDEEAAEERAAAMRARREAEEDDAKFPDEVEVPIDVPARQRFARYRGLKSFRTSPWDPREDLPPEYARVFAFENFRRAHRRARDAIAAAASQPGASVSGGTFVRVVLDAVPAAAAQRVVERVHASTSGSCPVLTAFGLLQHETKLSVVNYTVRKTQGYTEPVANKEELLFVTGIRSYPARPVFSTDEHGADKHKLERFLHEGRSSVATVFAPICYPPMPLLAFKQHPRSGGSGLALAASGALRDCNPDRVVVKKIVLTGYPVRQHKSKAVVRFMFHHPDDVRWFRPVELWTKQGRRGRIREPVGTHGTMKCIFDGAVSQQDAVCMSLYKRAFPKWPEGMTFA